MRGRVLRVGALAVPLALAACGGGTTPSGSTGGAGRTAPTRAGESNRTACELLTTAEIQAALGGRVGEGRLIRTGDGTSCTWSVVGPPDHVFALVLIRAEAGNPESICEQVRSGAEGSPSAGVETVVSLKAVDGVGASAWFKAVRVTGASTVQGTVAVCAPRVNAYMLLSGNAADAAAVERGLVSLARTATGRL